MPDPLAKSFYRRFRERNTGWLRRIGALLFASVLMVSSSAVSVRVLLDIADGISAYRSPLAKFPPAGESTSALVPQVVLVVVDGLRADLSTQMPTLQRLRAQGAVATINVAFPVRLPSLTTLLSGAGPEINDAPLLDSDAAPFRPIRPETLFTTVQRAGLNTAVAGPANLQELIPPQFLSEAYFTTDSDPAVADRRANDAAIAFIENFAPNFALIEYTLPDAVARRSGATGDDYRQALNHTDQLLAQLVSTLNLRQSVLVVTSSHGHIDSGGSGGPEGVVTLAPLVIVGQRIKPGNYDAVTQHDIAPTIAALAGGTIPSASQGAALFSLLEMDDVQRALKALALAQQQRDFGISYLAAIGGKLSEAALNDPPVARSSFEVKNYPSAFTLANLSVLQAQHDMGVARAARIEKEQVARAPITLLLLGGPLLILWFRRSLRMFACGLMAVGIVGVYHWAYLNARHLYSFSDFRTPEAFVREGIEYAALALAFGGLLVIILHWRDLKPSRLRVALTFLQVCAITFYLISIPFTVGYFFNGLTPEWYLGSLNWAFVQVFSLVSSAAIMALAVPAAALVALLYWLALILFHRIARLRLVTLLATRLKRLPISD